MSKRLRDKVVGRRHTFSQRNISRRDRVRHRIEVGDNLVILCRTGTTRQCNSADSMSCQCPIGLIYRQIYTRRGSNTHVFASKRMATWTSLCTLASSGHETRFSHSGSSNFLFLIQSSGQTRRQRQCPEVSSRSLAVTCRVYFEFGVYLIVR